MTGSQGIQETIDEQQDVQQIENARVGYQVATSLWNSRAGEFWSQFNAMLTANSIVLAAATAATVARMSEPATTAGAANAQESILSLLSIGVPVVGLALCALWCALHERAVGYNTYWARSARRLEEQFLKDPITTLSWGKRFGHGEEIKDFGDPEDLQMNLIGRIRVKYAVRSVIIVFAAMYLAILVWGLRGLN